MEFLSRKSKTVLGASATLAIFSFGADLVALLRDRILAANFGASRTLDIYYSAFKVPDFIFNLLVLGAVSSAFIPVFIGYYREDAEKAWQLTQNFLSWVFVGVLIACGIIFIFTEPIVRLVTPGFQGRDMGLMVQLTRLMLLSPIIFSVSTIVGSVLQSLERFLAYAIAPIFYNLGIIVGALYFAPLMTSRGQSEVLGLGLGVILGALLHLLIQLPVVIRVGLKFKAVFDWSETGLQKVFKLMIPRTIGLGAYSIGSIVMNSIASTMAVGSIAIFNFANNLQFVPIAVVGVSVATAIFPRLSSHAAGSEITELKRKLNRALINTLLIVLPGSLLVFVFRRLIIEIVFGVGLFHGTSVELTASVLGIFMFGVWAQSLIPILSRAFYALQNTRTPVIVSLITIGINIALALFFSISLNWDIRGLAWSFSIAGNLNFFLLYIWFRKSYL